MAVGTQTATCLEGTCSVGSQGTLAATPLRVQACYATPSPHSPSRAEAVVVVTYGSRGGGGGGVGVGGFGSGEVFRFKAVAVVEAGLKYF